jgi:hypothetical protein
MLETGFVIFLGAVLILAKLPRRLILRALHRPLAIDLTVSALVFAIHWGTWSGTFAAATAGLFTSILSSALKRLLGFHDGERYHPGVINLDALK